MLASVPLSALHVDRSVSLRSSDCQPTIRRYAHCLQAGDHFPSLDVCVDENGEYWLADGFLRYDAHTLIGTDEVTVRVHPGGARGARAFACGANDLHGLRRTVAEKRAAVERMLADPEWKIWSDHLIADNCRVSHTFVAKLRARLESGVSERPQRTGRDGRPVKRRQVESRPAAVESGPHAPGSARQPRQQRPATDAWVRATPTAPGLCELPRMPARRDLPPVDPERAKVALDPLAHARDLLLAARGLLIEAQAVVPDPNCPAVAEGIDHALTNLLPWLERVDPNFEEEGRPPQLPRVVEAASCLTAERANLRSAVGTWLPATGSPAAAARRTEVTPPAIPPAPSPPTPAPSLLKSMRPEAVASVPPRVGAPISADRDWAAPPLTSSPARPAWMTPAMYEAVSAWPGIRMDCVRQWRGSTRPSLRVGHQKVWQRCQ